MQKIQASKAVKALKNKKGFTLIEIIVVLVILAIMAAALIPTMMGYVDDARQKTQLATARAYYTAALAVVTEEVALKGMVDETADIYKPTTSIGKRWKELTIDLPDAGVEATCVVTLDAATNGTSIASVQYNYATDKNVRLTIGAGGKITISYDDKTPTPPPPPTTTTTPTPPLKP